jgi:hypothetical protein
MCVVQVKLAITYALAQSTKLSLHERRVTEMVLETKHLPESLAETGKVSLSPETIAKLIGKVRWAQSLYVTAVVTCFKRPVILQVAQIFCGRGMLFFQCGAGPTEMLRLNLACCSLASQSLRLSRQHCCVAEDMCATCCHCTYDDVVNSAGVYPEGSSEPFEQCSGHTRGELLQPTGSQLLLM